MRLAGKICFYLSAIHILILYRNAATSHGITIGDIFSEGRWQTLTLTSTGEMWQHMPGDVFFHLPACVPEDLAIRCGIDVLGKTPVEVNARVELLRRLRQIEVAFTREYNKLTPHMKAVYDQVRSLNANEWTEITLDDVMRIVAPTSQSDFMTLLAVHKQLMDHYKEFVVDPFDYRTSRSFTVRPIAHLERIAQVSKWAHKKNGPIQEFSERARLVITQNQQRTIKSRGALPSEQQRSNNVFTDEDVTIIRFLQDSISISRDVQVDPYPVPISTIVKAIGTYDGDVNDAVVIQLLVDLGTVAPWQDLPSQRRELGLDQAPPASSGRVAAANIIVKKALAKPEISSPTSGNVLGPEDFYRQDLAESIRHDFGNLPVYVIDTADAEELDDGISIEPVQSEPDTAWVHVHIADPTSVLPPTHVFALQAREQMESAYFSHRTWPLLPEPFMRNMLGSVGSTAASGQPEPVMSFSYKVDSTGDIVDYKVRAGIVRKVIRTTYEAVDRALGLSPVFSRYPFGGEPPLHTEPVGLDEHQLADIYALAQTIGRVHQRTLKLPMWNPNFSTARVQISPKPIYPSLTDLHKPPLFSGFPKLTYTVENSGDIHKGARGIVMRCMVNASQVASRWALDHGVPLLRRSSGAPLGGSDSDIADLLAAKDSRGCVDQRITLRSNLLIPSAEYTLQPAQHWSLGIPEGEGYSRVTSPLRRFGDMVAHWQIKHALINPKSSQPMFSPEWLDAYGKELIKREKVWKKAETDSRVTWALRFIQRWIQDPTKSDGPDPLSKIQGFFTSQPKTNIAENDLHVKCSLPALGLQGFVVGLRHNAHIKANNPESGDPFVGKIKDIRLGSKPQLTLDLVHYNK